MTNMYMPTQYIKTMEAFKTYINKLDASKKYDIDKTKERILDTIYKLQFQLKDIMLSFETRREFLSHKEALDTLSVAVSNYTTIEQLVSLKLMMSAFDTYVFNNLASYHLTQDADDYYGDYRTAYIVHSKTMKDLRNIIINDNALNIFEIDCNEGNNIRNFSNETDNTYANTEYFISTAKQYINRVIKGGLKGAFVSNNFFDVVILTPRISYRYETDAFGKLIPIKESIEIRNYLKYVRQGGLYIITLPATRIDNSLALFLSRCLSENTLIFKEPNSSLQRVVVVGQKEVSNKPKQSLLDRLTYIDYDSLETTENAAPTFSIPQEVLELEFFRGSKLDVEDILEAANNNLINNFTSNQTKPLVVKDQSPLLPFNIGQVGLVLTSGCLDGVVEEMDGVYHIIKGMTTKLTTTENDDSEEDQIKSTETISNQVKINVFTADGEFIALG